MRAVALLLVTLLSCNRAVASSPDCWPFSTGRDSYVICKADPQRESLRVVHHDASGKAYGSFAAYARDLWRSEHLAVVMAVNGGMYEDDLSPVGLLRSRGMTEKPANLKTGFGNFFLQPNGIFHFGPQGAGVTETRHFLSKPPDPSIAMEATQSGPMLVIDGRLHPAFRPESDSRKIRNGVGVNRQGQVFFVRSETPVNFHDFASLFKEMLDTPSALFLDGSISSLWCPAIGLRDQRDRLGPMIVLVRHAAL